MPTEEEWLECSMYRGKSNFKHLCGASLLNHRWLLTARHCVVLIGQKTCGLYGESWVCGTFGRNEDLVVTVGTISIKGHTYEQGFNFGIKTIFMYLCDDIVLFYNRTCVGV